MDPADVKHGLNHSETVIEPDAAVRHQQQQQQPVAEELREPEPYTPIRYRQTVSTVVSPEQDDIQVGRTTKTERAPDGRATTTTTITTHKTRDGDRVVTKQTRQITKVGEVGSTDYSINITQADEIAERLASVFQSKSMPGTSGLINVRTESWSSDSGKKTQSQRSYPWEVGDKLPGVHPQSADATSNSSAPSFVSVTSSPEQDQQQQQQHQDHHPQQQQRRTGSTTTNTSVQRSASSIKQVLLDWCKATVNHYPNVSVKNFSSSWNDGLAFCALIHRFYPEAFDYNQLSRHDRRYNFQLAFDTAEKYADIVPLLDVDDMVAMQNPDWQCVFTYLQSFYRRFAMMAQRQHQRQPQQPDDVNAPSLQQLMPLATSEIEK